MAVIRQRPPKYSAMSKLRKDTEADFLKYKRVRAFRRLETELANRKFKDPGPTFLANMLVEEDLGYYTVKELASWTTEILTWFDNLPQERKATYWSAVSDNTPPQFPDALAQGIALSGEFSRSIQIKRDQKQIDRIVSGMTNVAEAYANEMIARLPDIEVKSVGDAEKMSKIIESFASSARKLRELRDEPRGSGLVFSKPVVTTEDDTEVEAEIIEPTHKPEHNKENRGYLGTNLISLQERIKGALTEGDDG